MAPIVSHRRPPDRLRRAHVRDRRDRHQPQRRRSTSPSSSSTCAVGRRLRRGEVPEAHARAVRARRAARHRPRDAVGPHDVPRLPLPGRVRPRRVRRDRSATARERGIALVRVVAGTSQSVDFIEQFDPPCYKIASASLTDHALLERIGATGRPVILSTGMSTMDEIRDGGRRARRPPISCCSRTRRAPTRARPDELNLRMIDDARATSSTARSATRATRSACRRRSRRSRSARASSSATSRSTARCGAPTRPRRSSRAVSRGSCATSASSRPRSATA